MLLLEDVGRRGKKLLASHRNKSKTLKIEAVCYFGLVRISDRCNAVHRIGFIVGQSYQLIRLVLHIYVLFSQNIVYVPITARTLQEALR